MQGNTLFCTGPGNVPVGKNMGAGAMAAACHFGRKCRLVNNLNGNGVKCVCLKHKNGGKNEQLQWTE